MVQELEESDLRGLYVLETSAKTLKIGKVAILSACFLVPCGIALDFRILHITTLLFWRLLMLVPFIILIPLYLFYFKKNLQYVVPYHAFCLSCVMFSIVGINYQLAMTVPTLENFRGGGTGAISVVVFIVGFFAGGARRFIAVIIFVPMISLCIALGLNVQMTLYEWSFYINPFVAAVITIVACRFQEKLSYQEFLMRKLADSRALELARLNRDLQFEVEQSIQKIRYHDQLLAVKSRQAIVGEMLHNISHQWRQPLNTVGIILQSIEFESKSENMNLGKIKSLVSQGMKVIMFLSQTIDDFRNFFKPNNEKKIFSITEMIKMTLSIVDATLKDNRIRVQSDIGENIELLGLPNEFCQAVLNLIQNSKEALVEQNISDRLISICVFQQNGSVVITVQDNAGGIPPEAADRLFDLYYTNKKDGSGIGLPMTKTIVEGHLGGTIVFCNKNGGTEFRITLPICPDEKSAEDSSMCEIAKM